MKTTNAKIFFLTIAAFAILIGLSLSSYAQSLSFAVQAAPGDLDLSFGNGGKVVTDFGDQSQIRALAIQSDGKIVTAGVFFNVIENDFSLARYNIDGSLDTSFGNDGKVVTTISSGNDTAFAVAIQSDGKIVVAGSAQNETDLDFAVARYNINGSLDASFGSNGIVMTKVGAGHDYAYAMKIQADGKIVAAGQSFNGTNLDFALVRYNQNGSLDASFGTDGKVTTPVGTGNDYGAAMALQADGKIVVSGGTGDGTEQDIALARYNPNGSLDRSFGTGGKVITPIGNSYDFAYAVTIQSDGKIVAVGESRGSTSDNLALVRYNPNGFLDADFGTGGKVLTPIVNMGNGNHDLFSVAIQSNGKIVVAGRVNTDGLADFLVARYNPNGLLDTGFGNNGLTITAIGGGVDVAWAVAIQSDGKIVAGGWRGAGGIFSFALVRYHGDQTRSTQFDFDGDSKADISVYRPSTSSWYRLNSGSNNSFSALQFGISTDKLASADYDGDSKTDIAVFREGNWYYLRSSDGAFRAIPFGQAGDIPVPADYDGDNKADIAVFRQGIWYLLQSATNQFRAVQFGFATDKPVQADYDGDAKADVAVFRDGFWYRINSGNGQFNAVQFGQAGDIPVQADYDADSKADQAVYRNGVWYLLRSTAGFTGAQFGISTDVPVAADYDGDGKADIAVFRDGFWYRINTGNGQFNAIQFGIANDNPIPSAFLR